MILLILAGLSLAAGLGVALAHFWGYLDQNSYRNLLLLTTVVYFVFATLWGYRKPER